MPIRETTEENFSALDFLPKPVRAESVEGCFEIIQYDRVAEAFEYE